MAAKYLILAFLDLTASSTFSTPAYSLNQLCESPSSFNLSFPSHKSQCFKMAQDIALPVLPVPLEQLLPYLSKHDDTPTTELFHPFREYDAKMRELYAQAPETIGHGINNAVSIFDAPGLKTRARDIATDSSQETDRYIMPLTDENRRASGTPATVLDMEDFKHNFSVFTEMCLSDMDWSNVVVGGSAALTPLLPHVLPSQSTSRAAH